MRDILNKNQFSTSIENALNNHGSKSLETVFWLPFVASQQQIAIKTLFLTIFYLRS